MNSRSMITLGIAVVIGLVAMKLSQQMLSGKSLRREDSQEVLVAARDFKEEEILKADMVKVSRMVRSAIPPNAFSTFKDVEDRWVRTTMLEGDVLVEKKLGAKGTPPGLVANIPKGMRALAIDVTEQSGVSGFILPGHHVDVVRYETSEKNNDARRDDSPGRARARRRPDLHSPGRTRGAVANGHPGASARGRRHPGRRSGAGALSLSLRGVNDHEKIAKQKARAQGRPRG